MTEKEWSKQTYGNVRFKQGRFWTVLEWLIMVFTFGKNRNSNRNYVTTIGDTIWVPPDWKHARLSQQKLAVLRHEEVHIDQFRACGLGNAKAGIPLMAILYLLLPLPIGFSFRYLFERAAYLEEMRWRAERKLTYSIYRSAYQCTGPNYAWPLPPFMREYTIRWFRERVTN